MNPGLICECLLTVADWIECCLYFNHTLFRGNRVSKMSSYDLNAFNSPNFSPLVNGDTRLLHTMASPHTKLFSQSASTSS